MNIKLCNPYINGLQSPIPNHLSTSALTTFTEVYYVFDLNLFSFIAARGQINQMVPFLKVLCIRASVEASYIRDLMFDHLKCQYCKEKKTGNTFFVQLWAVIWMCPISLFIQVILQRCLILKKL